MAFIHRNGNDAGRKNVEIPFTEDNGLTLSEVVNDLRPGTIYKFRVYVKK